MTTDPPTDVELERLRTPHPDQFDLDIEHTDSTDRDLREDAQQ